MFIRLEDIQWSFGEPRFVVVWVEDDGHPCLVLFEIGRGFAGDDGARLDAPPLFPEASERKDLGTGGPEGVLGLADPLVPRGGRNEAAPFFVGGSEGGLLGDRFAPSVEGVYAYAFVLGPGGNQAPAHGFGPSLTVGFAHDGDLVGGRKFWPEIPLGGFHAEDSAKQARVHLKAKSSTHGLLPGLKLRDSRKDDRAEKGSWDGFAWLELNGAFGEFEILESVGIMLNGASWKERAVVLERGKPAEITSTLVARDPVADALLGIGDDFFDEASQFHQRLTRLVGGHRG